MEKAVKDVQNDIKLRMMEFSNISLAIDDYGEIFSDFDPRPFSHRALSQDFLEEARRASRDKETGFELRLMMPANKRNPYHESIIKKRLLSHFKHHHHIEQKEIEAVIKRGKKFIAMGVFFITLGGIILWFHMDSRFIFNFALLMIEPAGWFSFWEGLNLVLFESKKNKPDYDFYNKMSNVEITFNSI